MPIDDWYVDLSQPCKKLNHMTMHRSSIIVPNHTKCTVTNEKIYRFTSYGSVVDHLSTSSILPPGSFSPVDEAIAADDVDDDDALDDEYEVVPELLLKYG
jgi:hypothetical protein